MAIMKPKTITTGKATLLVVELPDHTTGIIVHKNKITVAIRYIMPMDIPTPEGNWELVRKVSEFTEEDWVEIVDVLSFSTMGAFYKEYSDGTWTHQSATESGLSLLEANGVCFEYELRDKPECNCDGACGDEERHDCLGDHAMWQEAQSKVWEKERTYIFIKKD